MGSGSVRKCIQWQCQVCNDSNNGIIYVQQPHLVGFILLEPCKIEMMYSRLQKSCNKEANYAKPQLNNDY